jgi:hypothetical protein
MGGRPGVDIRIISFLSPVTASAREKLAKFRGLVGKGFYGRGAEHLSPKRAEPAKGWMIGPPMLTRLEEGGISKC